jgi:predicted Zn-dependent protease
MLGEESGRAIPNWLATHPDPGERVQTTRAIGNEWAAKLRGQNFVVGFEEHLRRIDGLIFGENPREGYV